MSAVCSGIVKTSPELTRPTKSTSSLPGTLDAKLDRLIREILPPTPYILRLEQSHGRRLPTPSQSYHWMQGTLFSNDEQELQYMTFRRPADGMLHAHGQWDDGKGGIALRDGPASQTSSGRTPLQNQSVKKKISLADYKKRDKTRIANGTTPAAQPEPNGVAMSLKLSDAETKNAPVEGAEISNCVTNKAAAGHETEVTKQTGSPGQKRSAAALTANENTEAIEIACISPPAKKLNTFICSTPLATQEWLIGKGNASKSVMPQTELVAATAAASDAQSAPLHASSVKATERAATVPNAKVVGSTPNDGLQRASELPPMLSPTLPNINSCRLPPLLSPTLPPEIEAAIAEAKGNRRTSNGSLNKHSRAPNSSLLSNRHWNSTMISAHQLSLLRRPESNSPISATIEKQDKGKLSSSSSQVDSMTPVHLKEIKKPALWVSLKIKKKYRRELGQYLRLKPTPTKSHWKKHKQTPPISLEGCSGALAPLNNKREGPHGNEDDSRPHIKRRRLSDNSGQRVGTPSLPASSSPPPYPAIAQRARLGASSSVPKSDAMQRAGSGQGFAATPLGQSRHGTPSVLERESPLKPELRAEYRAESTRLVSLARGLKHDSDKYLKREEAPEKEQKLGLVIAAESVLCFILAAEVYDEPSRRDGHAGNAAQWRSILPLLRILTHRSKPYQHIYGLLQQLEGVIRDTIHHYDLKTLRGILRDSAKIEGAAEQEAALQRAYSTLKESYENESKASAAWREGQMALWVTELQSAFPKAWGQARRFPGRGKAVDAVLLKEYAKEGFALPMGPLTSGLEAVNFGMTLLVEHCEKEGIQWRRKLVL
ncbi:MAG: hypothetical protein Q9163_004677 [Psora crenata]